MECLGFKREAELGEFLLELNSRNSSFCHTLAICCQTLYKVIRNCKDNCKDELKFKTAVQKKDIFYHLSFIFIFIFYLNVLQISRIALRSFYSSVIHIGYVYVQPNDPFVIGLTAQLD